MSLQYGNELLEFSNFMFVLCVTFGFLGSNVTTFFILINTFSFTSNHNSHNLVKVVYINFLLLETMPKRKYLLKIIF